MDTDIAPISSLRASRTGRTALALVDRIGLRALERAIAHWKGDALLVALPDGTCRHLGDPEAPFLHHLEVERGRFFRRILWRGDLGFGESFVDGDWNSPDLTGLLRAFARQDADEHFWWSPATRLLDKIRHARRSNTREGSRRNISAHYDLGNEFYSAWLDRTMQYSAGIRPHSSASLEEAQDAKLRVLIGKLQVRPGMRVLEIGSGWGELAVRLARDHGCEVVTVTLSHEQRKHVAERAVAEGLSHRLEARLQDYRDIQGTFDRVVSVEMVEAVGHENLPGYFATIERLLAPGGHAVIQAITVGEPYYEAYRRRTDWIQAHVFPGAVCPSISALVEGMSKGSRLVLRHLEDIGPHYARDLSDWRDRFLAAWPRLTQLGFDERFRRLWTYYLGYCEAGFAERRLGDIQMVVGRVTETGLSETIPSADGILSRRAS